MSRKYRLPSGRIVEADEAHLHTQERKAWLVETRQSQRTTWWQQPTTHTEFLSGVIAVIVLSTLIWLAPWSLT